MELRDYLRVLRKGWAVILAFVIVGIGLGVGLTVTTTKVYKASAQVFVSSSAALTTQEAQSGNNFALSRVQSYISIATAPAVTGPVIKALGLHLTSQQLADKISADAPVNKVLINLHVSDHDPARAARIANAVASQFDVVVEATEQTGTSPSIVKLSVIHPATVPSAPISPDKLLNIGLGLVLGLLIGIGFAVGREVLDTTVKGPRDFEELGVPILGNVPLDKRTSKTPIAFRGDPHSARSEAYRQIRTNLQFVDVDNPPRIIAVTSAIPGEGKSTSAINLAAALAEAGARVCLIEADLRRPSIARVLGLVGDVGFTTVVIGKAPVETVLQNAGRNLAVLTSGPIPPNPSELLLSKHAKQVIFDIAAKVDFTIIDTPPLLPVTDGAEIATIADATILVHRASKTTRDQVFRSVEALAKVGKKPVGVILNMVTRTGGRYDYEYGYYYEAYRPNTDSKGKTRKPEDGQGHSEAGLYPTDDGTSAPGLPVTPPPPPPPVEELAGPDAPESQAARGGRRRKQKARRGDRDPVDQVVPSNLPPTAAGAGPGAYALPPQQQHSTPPRQPGTAGNPASGAPLGGPFAGSTLPPAQNPGFGPVPVPVVTQQTTPTNGAEPPADNPVPPTPLWFRSDGPQS
ncbi:polysaccharide biosynthesis tyrosine autokinase [Jatrophihabitans sp.]|uniref:polysaccharide biosynthesis tyrosine autokinase n=1 Tax=Jatrophihabitans sp. TaxID=1932789 RepID=UPI0030C778D1|nr:capsular exopolysaccharide family [Jatrophihabitans sp.]